MWLYENKELDDLPDGCVAFVYQITNLTNNKRYIGKKRRFFLKTKQVNKKKKKYKVESDWREYFGSNDSLKDDVEKLGPENFRREILYLCYGLGEASYLEAKEQFINDVLLSDDWYNDWISVRVTSVHVKRLKKC